MSRHRPHNPPYSAPGLAPSSPLPRAELKNDIGGRAFGLVKRLPQVQGRLRSEKGKLREDLRHSLKGKDLGPVYTALPEEGWDAQKVVSAIDRFVEGEKVGGRCPPAGQPVVLTRLSLPLPALRKSGTLAASLAPSTTAGRSTCSC